MARRKWPWIVGGLAVVGAGVGIAYAMAGEEDATTAEGFPVGGTHRDWGWRAEQTDEGAWRIYIGRPDSNVFALIDTINDAQNAKPTAIAAIDAQIAADEAAGLPSQFEQLPAPIKGGDLVVAYDFGETVNVNCDETDCDRVWVGLPYESLTYASRVGQASAVEATTAGEPGDGELYVRWDIPADQEMVELVHLNQNTGEEYVVVVSTKPATVTLRGTPTEQEQATGEFGG